MPIRDIIVFLIVFGTIPAIFYRAYIGVLVWSWLAYMNPHRLTWGPAHFFPFAQVIGIVTLISLVFDKERRRVPINGLTVVWVLLIVWMNVTTFFALVPDLAFGEWKRVMKIQFFSFISLMLIYGKDRINYLIYIIAGSIGFYGLKGGIFALATGGSSRVYGPRGSFIEDNNGLGLALVIVVPLMIYILGQVKHHRYLRPALIVMIGFNVLAILSTQSRGAFLAVSATFAWVWLKSNKKMLFGILIAIAAPIFFLSMPQSWHDRMATIKEYEQDGSAMGRINAWGFAYNLAVDRPLVGGGFRAFVPELFQDYAPEPDDFHDAHSIYFEMLGEHGFVGLGLFLMLGLGTLRVAGQVIKRTQEHADLQWANSLARMLQASLVAYATGGTFLGLAYWDLPYHLIVVVVMLREHVNEVLGGAGASSRDDLPSADSEKRPPAVEPRLSGSAAARRGAPNPQQDEQGRG